MFKKSILGLSICLMSFGILSNGLTFAANTDNIDVGGLFQELGVTDNSSVGNNSNNNGKLFNSKDTQVWDNVKEYILTPIANLFYFNFYNKSFEGFFGNIPGITFVKNHPNIIWWLAFIMAIVTAIVYLFVDRKVNDGYISKYLGLFGQGDGGGMGMQDPMMGQDPMAGGVGGMGGMGMQDPMMGQDPMAGGVGGMGGMGGVQTQEKDLWTLIKTNFLLAMNDKVKTSDKMLIWGFIAYIIISLILIAAFINSAFSNLIQPASEQISYLIYNIFVIIAGVGIIFLGKTIYIDSLINIYMNQRTEPSLKPAIVVLFAYAIIAIVIYSALYAIQGYIFT